MTIEIQPSTPSSVIGDGGVTAPDGASGSKPLMPDPGGGGLTGTEDALSILYSLVAQQGQLAVSMGEANVTSAQKSQEAELALEKAAEIAQQQAEESQGGFWHDLLSFAEDVAKVAGIVVAAAAGAVATVCTGGAAGVAIVAIAAVLVSSGAVVSATHCLGDDSAAIGTALEVGGSIMTMGATSGAITSSIAEQSAQAASDGAQVVEGGATVLAGAASIEIAHFQGESEEDAADVKEAIDAVNRRSRMVNDLLDGLKSTEESNKNALQIIAGATRTYGQTLTLAAAGGKA